MGIYINRAGPQLAQAGDPFTQREIEVLNALAEGLSNKEIAERLVVVAKTVEFHTSQIRRKLGIVGASERRLVVEAVRRTSVGVI